MIELFSKPEGLLGADIIGECGGRLDYDLDLGKFSLLGSSKTGNHARRGNLNQE